MKNKLFDLKKMFIDTIFTTQIFLGIGIIVLAIGLSNSSNPILARTGANASHTLVWIMIGLSMVCFGLKTPRISFKMTIYSIMGVLVAVAMTEDFFQLANMLVNNTLYQTTLTFNLGILGVLAAALILKFYKVMDLKRFSIYLGIMFLFFAAWIYNGFHVTLDLAEGKTAFYSDYATNAIEILQWIIGMSGFFFVYRGSFQI